MPNSTRRRFLNSVRWSASIALFVMACAIAASVGCQDHSPTDSGGSAIRELDPESEIVKEARTPLSPPGLPQATETPATMPEPVPGGTTGPTPTAHPTPVATETAAPMPEPVVKSTAEPTPTAHPTPVVTETAAPMPEPVVKSTAEPTPTAHPTPMATETAAPMPEPVVKSTAEPTPTAHPTPVATETAAPMPEPVVKSTAEPPPTAHPTPVVTETAAPTPEPTVGATAEPTPAPEPPPPTPTTTAITDERVVVEPDAEIENGCLNTGSGKSRTYTPRGEAPPKLLTAVDQLQWVREADPNSVESISASYLKGIGGYAPEVLEALLERPWLTNYGDRTADRYQSTYPLLVRLIELVRRDKDIALQTVRHPIFDTLDWGETSLTDFITDLTWSDPEGLHAQMQFLDRIDALQSSTDSHLGFLYLQVEFPEVAEEVAALSWVEDGLEMNEIDVLFAIARLQVHSPQATQNIFESGETLLQQPTAQIHALALEALAAIGALSQEAALFLTQDIFLDSTVVEYYELVNEIEQLAKENPEFLCQMLDHPAFSAGDNSFLVAELPLILLEATQPDAARKIRAIPWVADGIWPSTSDSDSISGSAHMVFEAEFVQHFVQMQRSSPDFLSRLIQQPWLRDGFSPMERQVFYDVIDIGARYEPVGLATLELPVFDPVNSESHSIVDRLRELIFQDLLVLFEVVYDPSVLAASRDELHVAIWRAQLESQKPNIRASIDSLPWVNDGAGAGEKDALLAIMNLGIFSDSDSLTQGVLAKSWVQDGLNTNELHAVRQLTGLSRSADGQPGTPADQIINMPFLDAVDAADAAAIEALGTWFRPTTPYSIDPILSHPTLRGGITDEHTVMVAMLDMISHSRPELLETILDPEVVTIVERLIQTKYSGEMLLAVLVTEPDVQLTTMDLLEQVVRHHEEFMQVPYPRGYVMLLVADATDRLAGGGPRGFMTVDPGLELDETTIAHETAHQYWAFAPEWMAEGAATFLESKYSRSEVLFPKQTKQMHSRRQPLWPGCLLPGISCESCES